MGIDVDVEVEVDKKNDPKSEASTGSIHINMTWNYGVGSRC